MAIQDIKRKAKSELHIAFSMQCDYLPIGSESPPLNIPVRKYESNPIDLGQFNGNSSGWAEMSEDYIYMVLRVSDVIPDRGDLITHPDGQYHVNRVLQTKDGYVTIAVLPV